MLNVDEFEAWNVLRYEKGQHYYAHHDYFDPELFNEYKQNPWTQRHYTLLVYLSEPEDGGETVFPWEGRYRDQDPGFQFESCDFGVRVRPKKGVSRADVHRLLSSKYDHEQPRSHARHRTQRRAFDIRRATHVESTTKSM